jgi:hypothetical protein
MRSLVLFAATLLAAARPADALTFDAGYTLDGSVVVVAGQFLFSDDFGGFERIVRESEARWVTFDSPGGDLYRAMEFGRLIRRLKLDTFAWRDLKCESACAYAFLGGAGRYAEAGSIGVHRSWIEAHGSLSAEDAVEAVQEVTADVMGYMAEMGVDPQLMRLALQYETSDMRYLSLSEMEQFRVTNVVSRSTSAIAGDPVNEPQADVSAASILRPLHDGNPVYGRFTDQLPRE